MPLEPLVTMAGHATGRSPGDRRMFEPSQLVSPMGDAVVSLSLLVVLSGQNSIQPPLKDSDIKISTISYGSDSVFFVFAFQLRDGEVRIEKGCILRQM